MTAIRKPRWSSFAVIVCLSFGGSVAWSQQPPPNQQSRPPQPTATENQQGAKEDGKAPVVAPAPSQAVGDEKASHDEEGGGKKDWSESFVEHAPDWSVAFFTFVLCVFTGLLWRSTNKLWLAGEKQMKLIEANAAQQSIDMQASNKVAQDAAEAAKISAATLVSAERAHLWMQKVILHGITKEGTGPRKVSFSYIVINVGHSPAFMYEVSITFSFGSLPSLPEYVTLPKEGFTFIAPNNGIGTSPVAPIPSADGGGQFIIAADLVERYRSGEVKIYVHGVIRYRDPISAAGYSAGFCYIIRFGDGDDSEGCSPTGGSVYWTYT